MPYTLSLHYSYDVPNMINKKNHQSYRQFQELLNDNEAMLVINFNGLTSNSMNNIRSHFRSVNMISHVFKNKIAKICLEACSKKKLDELNNNLLYVFSTGDLVELAKSAISLSNQYKTFNINLLVDLEDYYLYGAEQIRQFSLLPSKAESYAQLNHSLSEAVRFNILRAPVNLLTTQLASIQ